MAATRPAPLPLPSSANRNLRCEQGQEQVTDVRLPSALYNWLRPPEGATLIDNGGLTFLLGAIIDVYFSSRSWMRGCFWNSDPSTAMVVDGLSMRSSREARPAAEPERIGLRLAVTLGRGRGHGRGQGGWEVRTHCDQQGGTVRGDLAHPLHDEDVVRVEVEVEVVEDLFGVAVQAVYGIPSDIHTQKYS